MDHGILCLLGAPSILQTNHSNQGSQTSIMNQNTFAIGIALALVGTFLFSLKPIVVKFAYAYSLNSEQLITLRMIFSLPFYLVVGYLAIQRKPERKTQLKSCLFMTCFLGVLGYFFASYLDLLGLQYISAQLERVVLFCFPTIVVILSRLFFNTPLPPNIWWLLGMSYFGILLIFGHDLVAVGENILLGTLFVFLSAVCFSVYVLWSKFQIAKIGSQLFTSLAMASASICIFVLFLIKHDLSELIVSSTAYFICAVLALVCTVIPSLMVAEGISRIGPERTSIIGTVGPVITSIFAIFILDEIFTFYHALGLFFVCLAIYLMSKTERTKITQ